MKPYTTEVRFNCPKIANLDELIDALITAKDIANQSGEEIDVDVDFVSLEAECLSDGSIVYNVYGGQSMAGKCKRCGGQTTNTRANSESGQCFNCQYGFPTFCAPPEEEHDEDNICECGSIYGEHYSNIDGDDWCPTRTRFRLRY